MYPNNVEIVLTYPLKYEICILLSSKRILLFYHKGNVIKCLKCCILNSIHISPFKLMKYWKDLVLVFKYYSDSNEYFQTRILKIYKF